MASIQDIRKLKDPQKVFQWEVIINGKIIPIDDNQITLKAQEVNVPNQAIEVIELPHKGYNTYWRGRDASSNEMSITFFDSVDMRLYHFFKQWLNIGLQNEVNGGGLYKEDYTAEIGITTFTDKENEEEMSSWIIKNAFPKELSDIQLSYDDESILTFEVTFQFDASPFNIK